MLYNCDAQTDVWERIMIYECPNLWSNMNLSNNSYPEVWRWEQTCEAQSVIFAYIYIYNICIWYAEIVIWAEHMFELICLPLTIYAETLLWANIYYIFNYILNLYITQGIYNIVVKQEFEQIYVFRGIIVEFMSGAQTQLWAIVSFFLHVVTG